MTIGPQQKTSRSFFVAIFAVFIWVNISEIFRYFVFIMPMMRKAFPTHLDVAPMTPRVFMLWGVWDLILIVSITGFSWMYFNRFGYKRHHILLAATFVWMAVFGIFWLGMWNLNLATPSMLAIAWPLSWIEMVIAALIVHWGMINTK